MSGSMSGSSMFCDASRGSCMVCTIFVSGESQRTSLRIASSEGVLQLKDVRERFVFWSLLLADKVSVRILLASSQLKHRPLGSGLIEQLKGRDMDFEELTVVAVK